MKFLEKIRDFFGVKEKMSELNICETSNPTENVDFVNMDENEFFPLLSKILKDNNSNAVLFGAISMNVYGYQRHTFDVDFMLPKDDLQSFNKMLESIGYRKVLQTTQYAKFRHENDAFMDIDTIFIDADNANKIIKLAEMKNISGDNAFLCASLETILATKLHAIKYNNESREGKDVTDIKMLVKANNIAVSDEWFKTLCIKYADEYVYDNIFKNQRQEN